MAILRSWILVCLLCLTHAPEALPAQTESPTDSSPLPELSGFLDRIKDNLKSDRLLLSNYSYNRKSITRHLDGQGRVQKTETSEYEIYPSLDPDMTYERLISKNGQAVDAEKIEEQDRKYQKKADKRARQLAEERKSEQEERLAREAEESRKERETVEDMLKLYEFSLLNRETIGGHSAIWVQFTPKPHYKPQTKDGKILKKLQGRALVSETDYQVIRVEVELIEDFSLGLGLLARVHKGTKLKFTRQKINDEIWLPAEFQFTGSARALLLKRLRVESTSVFSDHKKFSVSSMYELSGIKPAQ